ncbi:MAG TPA: hypothetical protein VLS27_04705 [Gammaproteobacteria bacterium]|nr:hypothetical protein [Gammaproteobacteria bacterium]
MFISENRFVRGLTCGLSLMVLPLTCAAWQTPAGISMEIVSDDGQVLRQFDVTRASERNTRRAYLEATKGQRYGIRVRNHTGRRIGLVLAVDGRNVISGKKSNLRRSEPMYVLNPYQSATYDGWRTSDTRVHRFFFTESGESYAGAFGDHSAMGVIAVAAYAEKMPPARTRDYRQDERLDRSGEAASMPGAAGKSSRAAPAEEADAQPGTGFGEGRSSHVVRVHFKPQRLPFVKQFIKYEWRQTLVELGFIHAPKPHNRFWPQGKRASTEGYSPYPPGYWNPR